MTSFNIQEGQRVTVLIGEYSGYTGIIKHIFSENSIVADVALDNVFSGNGYHKVCSYYIEDLKLIKKMNRNGANSE